ncbi:MAG: hypothetical protein M3P83_07945 [Actinomycetota bacterium]|nr:hypothetical protein [Actinomycetota bacterium]
MRTTRLKDLTTTPGPFASAYFDSSQDTEAGAHERDLRWRAVVDALRDQGASDATIDVLDASVRDAPPVVGRGGHALIAAGDTVLLDEQLPEPPPTPVVRWSPLPFLLPLVELGGPGVPYLLVVVDKIGANVRAVDAGGRVIDADSFDLDEHPVHKVGGGGWAHLRMQRAAEETVRRNIEETAERIGHLIRSTGAGLLVLAGEVQSRAALRDALPPQSAQRAVEVEVGGRAAGTDEDALDAAVEELVRFVRADADNAVRTRFVAELERPPHLARQGVARACELLAEANVDALLVDPDALGDRTVWTGANPMLVTTQAEDLKALGETDITEQRADEALPRAAVAGAADVVLAGEQLELEGGVGVILRHD